jgi:hypothetical protein
MRRLLTIVSVCAFTFSGALAFAQGRFGGGFRTGGFPGGFRGRGGRLVVHPFGSRQHRFSNDGVNNGLYSYPFYGDGFDSEYVGGSPQVIVIRDEAKTPAPAPAPAVSAQPKMIELPGSDDAKVDVATASPVVIIMRDGKRREMTRYTITGAYLYDSSKALQTSRIPIDDLDLEATVHANAERGVPFSIPTQRNEVVVRF